MCSSTNIYLLQILRLALNAQLKKSNFLSVCSRLPPVLHNAHHNGTLGRRLDVGEVLRYQCNDDSHEYNNFGKYLLTCRSYGSLSENFNTLVWCAKTR